MTASAVWEGAEPAITPSRPAGGSRLSLSFLVSRETWGTFALVLLAVIAVAASLEAANWVSEMPSLIVASLVGLGTALLLAHQRLPAALLHPVGLGVGLVVAFGEAMQTMRLEDPLLGGGVRVRWTELWGRLGEWTRALIAGDISTDPLPFVLMAVFAAWALAYLAGWAVFRWRNAWVALIPGGIALLTNISYLSGQPSREFIVFLFAAILLVARLHYLRGLRTWHEQRTWRPPHLGLEVLSAATWMGLALIFVAWVIPTANDWGPVADRWQAVLQPLTDRVDRIGRVFIGVRSNRDDHVHSFGDVLPLQGKVTLDDRVLLTVVAPDSLYLRGAVYDQYTAQGWKVSDASELPFPGTSVEAASFGTPETRAQLRRAVQADITIEKSFASRRLFTVGEALAADVDARVLVAAGGLDAVGLVPDERVRAGDSYSTVGTVSVASRESLAASGRDYPQWVSERYLQLPDDLPPEVRALAANVAGGEQQPYALATRIESFLRSEYAVDFDIPDPPPRRDAVTVFLFDVRRGYFDHHASAMAVMLRTLGIPTRVVTGFVLSDADLDRETKAYVVTERRAWTWPEVYFEGLGWVEFNPTPDQPLIVRPGDDPVFARSPVTGADALGFIDCSALGFEFSLSALTPEDCQALPSDASALAGSSTATADDGGGGFVRLAVAVVTITVLVSAVLVGIVAAVRGAWAYWFRGLRPASKRWAKLQLFASWAGVRTPVNHTPLESSGLLARVIDDPAIDMDALARDYTRERYGPGNEEPDEVREEREERLHGVYAAARNRLLRRAVSRRLSFRRMRLPGRQGAGS